jgi:hypothetical protein
MCVYPSFKCSYSYICLLYIINNFNSFNDRNTYFSAPNSSNCVKVNPFYLWWLIWNTFVRVVGLSSCCPVANDARQTASYRAACRRDVTLPFYSNQRMGYSPHDNAPFGVLACDIEIYASV